jgi:hypothetical protein
VIISITQKRTLPVDKNIDYDEFSRMSKEEKAKIPQIKFRGGCTLILNLKDLSLRYAIVKDLGDKVDDNGAYVAENERLKRQRDYRTGGGSRRATYFGKQAQNEPFALLHNNF